MADKKNTIAKYSLIPTDVPCPANNYLRKEDAPTFKRVYIHYEYIVAVDSEGERYKIDTQVLTKLLNENDGRLKIEKKRTWNHITGLN